MRDSSEVCTRKNLGVMYLCLNQLPQIQGQESSLGKE